MKKPTLYELIGELRETSDVFRYLNKQRIVDRGVEHHQKLLVGKATIRVCQHMLDNFNDAYTLDELLDMAIYDYINKTRPVSKT